MRSILVGLIVLMCAEASLARGPVRVRGYTTKNGTYVAPHYRSAPDRSRYNNWSTVGNVNPYTGKPGYKYPYGSSYSPYRYTAPSYGYTPQTYGYSPSYSLPSYSTPSYTPQNYGYSSPTYRVAPQRSSSRRRSLTIKAIDRPVQEAVVLASGVVKMPAMTKSGYCLQTPEDYVGTGSLNYPAITEALPRCEGA